MDNDDNAIITIDNNGISIDQQFFEKYLQNPALWFAEVLTGVATYSKKDFFLAGGRIIQGAIKLDFWKEFLNQLNKAREIGKIKRKFYESRNGRINFNELFTYLSANDSPDEEVFKALQAIFFASEQMESEQKDELLAYELMQVAKKMRSVDLRILIAAYQLYLKQKKSEKLNINTTQAWQIRISSMIGLPIDMIVDSRIKYGGNQDAKNPHLFSVMDDTSGVPNMGLNATSIALGEMISTGKGILQKTN